MIIDIIGYFFAFIFLSKMLAIPFGFIART